MAYLVYTEFRAGEARDVDELRASPADRALVAVSEGILNIHGLYATIVPLLIYAVFARRHDPVKDKLKRFGLFAQLGEQSFYPTLGAAVSNYLRVNNVEWEDWEDQVEP